MRPLRRMLSLAFLASLLSTAAFSEPEVVVARLVRHQPRVEAPPGAPISPGAPGAEIRKGTEVQTGKKASALFAVGTRPSMRGMLKLGPESRVIFEKWVVNAATGGEIGLDFRLGDLLVAFVSPKNDIQLEPGVEKWIETPTVRIRLHGTMVAVKVEKNGTTSVFVLEGNATVESNAGGTVELPAGTQTTVRPGESPTAAAPIDPGNAIAGLDPLPDGHSFSDPPLANLLNLNLDLPKVAKR
jgi:hypothetical protein